MKLNSMPCSHKFILVSLLSLNLGLGVAHACNWTESVSGENLGGHLSLPSDYFQSDGTGSAQCGGSCTVSAGGSTFSGTCRSGAPQIFGNVVLIGCSCQPYAQRHFNDAAARDLLGTPEATNGFQIR